MYTAEAVQAIVGRAVQEAIQNENKKLKVLMERPNGRKSIKRYMKTTLCLALVTSTKTWCTASSSVKHCR